MGRARHGRWREAGQKWVATPWLTLILVLNIATSVSTRGICPPRCSCDDALKAAACVGAALEVVPIQLNPEATHINLTENKIENLHFTLGFYIQVETLDISHNQIETLGTGNFETNDKLISLNISNNGILALEKNTFTGLVALVTLNLEYNKISSINVHTFKDLKKLQELRLSNNKLIDFESGVFKPLVNLKVLLVDNNQLLEIPSENLAYTPVLEYLSMCNNYLQNLSEFTASNLKKLKRLEIAENVISTIHPSAFDGLISLQYLNMNDNNLTFVPTPALSKLINLTHLALNGNFFDALSPVSFQSLFHLRHLHLSGLPRLSKIDARAFVDNINLEKLWMNDNIRVTVIPTRTFHGNPRLTHISIKNNNVFMLHSSHFPLDQLQSLQLSGNPLHCNCSLLWLWELGRDASKQSPSNSTESTDLYVDFPGIYCASPENLKNTLLISVPESTISCSMTWITIITILLSIGILVSVSGSVLYYMGILRRCGKEKSKHVMTDSDLSSNLPKMGNGIMYATNHQRPSDDKMDINRYLMMNPSIQENYHSTPPWHTMNKSQIPEDTMESMYQQYAYESIPHHKTMDRPHIVYV